MREFQSDKSKALFTPHLVENELTEEYWEYGESRASHPLRRWRELLAELLGKSIYLLPVRVQGRTQASICLLRGESGKRSGPSSALVLPRGIRSVGHLKADRLPLLWERCPHTLLPQTRVLNLDQLCPCP